MCACVCVFERVAGPMLDVGGGQDLVLPLVYFEMVICVIA